MSKTEESTSRNLPSPDDGPIVAYAGTYFRMARYAMAGLCLVFAAWFAYDGWIAWPELNRKYDEAVARGEKPTEDRKNQTSLNLNRLFSVTLPFVGVGVIVWLLYRSRGSYTLKDDVLTVPGHPAIPLENITAIDMSKYDRKGIAYVSYELAEGEKGTVTLDDFIYQRDPAEAIIRTIDRRLNPPSDPETESEPSETTT